MIISPKEPHQESLQFKIDDSALFDSLVTGENDLLIKSTTRAVANLSNELFYIFGPHGCGKTHLLTALFRQIKDPHKNAFFVDMALVKNISPQLIAVEPYPVTILDNIDAIAGDEDWELGLFALYNRWIDAGKGTFIVSSKVSADKIPFLRRDLNTRFLNGVSYPMQRLNEEDCAKALQIKAKKRAFILPDKVASYLIRHFNLDMPSLVKILNKLDIASMQERHEITIPFIKKVLKIEE